MTRRTESRKSGLPRWIDESNSEQMKWARAYLATKNGLPVAIYERETNTWLLQQLSQLSLGFLKTMGGAWRQERLRSNPHSKKSVSFTLTLDAKQSLKLAAEINGIPQNEMIERLIRKEVGRLRKLAKKDKAEMPPTTSTPYHPPIHPVWGVLPSQIK